VGIKEPKGTERGLCPYTPLPTDEPVPPTPETQIPI